MVDYIENRVGFTLVSKHDYTVNAIGQRTARAQSGTAFAQASTDVFGYNTKGEVTSATNATLSARNQGFTYDQIGNRSTFTTTAGTTGYTSNSLNQYTQVSGFSAQPSYDLDGNQTATGLGQTYVWDAENRLISAEPVFPANGDKKVLNTYDAQSRRVRRQVSTYAGGAWGLSTDEKFIFDGWNVVAVLNAGSGNTVLRTYTWGKDLSGSIQGAGGIGGLLSVKDGAAVYHYAYDANGNVSEVLSNSGSIAAHYEYTPFGDTVVASGAYASANEYRFSTKPFDVVSGLYYYGLRCYNPSTGRWPNRDTIGELGGVNMYSMVGNSPITHWDFLGLDKCSELRDQLARAQDTFDSYASQFGPGGPYEGLVTGTDAASLAAMTGSLSAATRGNALLADAARNGRAGQLGTTFYSGTRPSTGQAYGVAGNYMGLASAGLDGFSFGNAVVNGDPEGAMLAAGNIGVDLAAAAIGGPIGIGLAAGQLAINGALVGYGAYQNHQNNLGLMESAKAAGAVMRVADRRISELTQQIDRDCSQPCTVTFTPPK